MVTIVKDKELIFETENYDVILVGTSTYNMLTGGFQSKMRFKYPYIQSGNDKTNYGDCRKLGKRLTFYNEKPTISLMYICGYPTSRIVNIDYEALKNCLLSANAEFKGKKVASTIIGSSIFDGNGDKEKCLEIIKECTSDLDITLYDYVQKKRKDEMNKYFLYIGSFRKDKEKYKKLLETREDYLKSQFLN